MSAPRRERARRGRGERGAIIVFFALFMVALLTVTAIVVDLGMDRATIRNLKLDTDAAAIAAGFFLSGQGSASTRSNPQLACSAAVNSIRQNVNDFPTTAVSSGSCAALLADASLCGDTTPSISVVTTAPPYVLTIDYPVPSSAIVDLARLNGLGSNDGTNCKRMKVTLQRTNPSVFGAVVGRTTSTLRQSSVVKAGVSSNSFAVPALLLLERSNCGSLQASGQGGIRVKGSGTSSAWIHTDTAAGGNGSINSNCQGGLSCNANNYAISGTQLPNSVDPLPELAPLNPSIVAGDGTDGSAGIIGSYALNPAVAGAGGCTWPTGLNHPATAAQLVSRRPVDIKYNDATKPHGTNIADRHAAGYAAATGAAPVGWTTISGAACGQDNAVYTAASLYVSCSGGSGFSGKNVVFRGQRFIFTGSLNVAGGYVAFPNASSIVVRGCTGGGSCTDAIGLSSSGFLSVNSGEQGQSATLDGGTAPATWPSVDCLASRSGAGAGGSTTNWTMISTFSGGFTVQNSTANLCQASVYLGDNRPTYTAYQLTSGGNCSSSAPCPTSTPPTPPVFNLNSGSKPAISWTAPNQSTTGPTDLSPFDALTLWTEGGMSCSVGGQGAMKSSGVLFFPNCNFAYAGQADTNNPLNAQFIGRSLTMSGQGVLVLQPDPRIAVAVPAPGSIELIR